MVISIAVLIIPVLLIMAFFARPGDETVRPVDYQPVLAQARQAAPFEVLAPSGLPPTWVANRVRWAAVGESWLNAEPAAANSWQLGFVNPAGIYVAIQQRDGSPMGFISEVTRGAKPGDRVSAGGREWVRYSSSDGRTNSLVATVGPSTAVVTGDVPFAELEAFASTLSSS